MIDESQINEKSQKLNVLAAYRCLPRAFAQQRRNTPTPAPMAPSIIGIWQNFTSSGASLSLNWAIIARAYCERNGDGKLCDQRNGEA